MLCQHFRFQSAYGAMCSWKLSIDIGCIHRVGIDDGKFAHTCPTQHLGRIGTYATDTHDKHMSIA
jgi:hypothetical protein